MIDLRQIDSNGNDINATAQEIELKKVSLVFGFTSADYLDTKNQIKAEVDANGFNSLSDDQKVMYGEYNIDDGTNIVPFYESYYSESNAAAQARMLTCVSKSIKNNAFACNQRAESAELTECILTYLSADDARTFIDSVNTFESLYRRRALFGTNYGDNIDGIMDYIESTSSYVGAGLENYTIQNGTLQNFIDGLKAILL